LSLICTWFCFNRVDPERHPALIRLLVSAICVSDAGSQGLSSVPPFQSSYFQAGTTISALSFRVSKHLRRLMSTALVCSKCFLFSVGFPFTLPTELVYDFSFAF